MGQTLAARRRGPPTGGHTSRACALRCLILYRYACRPTNRDKSRPRAAPRMARNSAARVTPTSGRRSTRADVPRRTRTLPGRAGTRRIDRQKTDRRAEPSAAENRDPEREWRTSSHGMWMNELSAIGSPARGRHRTRNPEGAASRSAASSGVTVPQKSFSLGSKDAAGAMVTPGYGPNS